VSSRFIARVLAGLLACALLAPACGPPRTADVPGSAWDPDSVADAFARPVGALAWPFATRAVLVRPDGTLDDGAVRLSLEPRANAASAPPPRSRRGPSS